MNSITNNIKVNTKTVKQTSIVFIGNIILLLIGVGIKYLQTDILTVDDYGKYAFFSSIIGFSVLFYRFGYFSSIQVLLAENKNQTKEQEYIGIAFIIAFIIGGLFTCSIWGLSFFIDQLANVDIGNAVRLASPFCFLFVFKLMTPAISLGSNKVEGHVFFDIYSKLFFLILLVILPYFIKINLTQMIIFSVATFMIGMMYIWLKFKPSFKHSAEIWKEVREKNKTHGFQLYLGQTAQQTTLKFDDLFIAYFVNTTQLGFYSLAKFITSPITLFSQAMSGSLFKNFAKTRKIPSNVFIINGLWLVFSLVFIWITGDFIVSFLFGPEYLELTNYLIPLCFVFMIQAAYQPFIFLSAKSMGKEIRNIALIESITNLILNFALIPEYGVMGAIIATLISKFTYLSGNIYYYLQYLKTNKN